jgi:hypothetical protein
VRIAAHFEPVSPNNEDAISFGSKPPRRIRELERSKPLSCDLRYTIGFTTRDVPIAIVVLRTIVENLPMLSVLDEITLAVRHFLWEGLARISVH